MKKLQREILGKSQAVQQMVKLIEKVAPAMTNILIIGESGTGKELVARAIHELSPVCDKAFVAVNCGAIPETLIESELFGHKKGSFTGAHADKVGLFEAASGGTIFLDEIGELPLSMQVKLLRALQDKTIRKVGDNRDQKIEVRVVAATNRNLEEAVKKGTFREDLYFRLNVILVETPPLRMRTGDIEILAEKFLERTSAKMNRQFTGFSRDVMQIFLAHKWPGNIRELENVIERVATLETGSEITTAGLPPELLKTVAGAAHAPVPFHYQADFSLGPVFVESLQQELRLYLEREALKFTRGDADAAGKLLR